MRFLCYIIFYDLICKGKDTPKLWEWAVKSDLLNPIGSHLPLWVCKAVALIHTMTLDACYSSFLQSKGSQEPKSQGSVSIHNSVSKASIPFSWLGRTITKQCFQCIHGKNHNQVLKCSKPIMQHSKCQNHQGQVSKTMHHGAVNCDYYAQQGSQSLATCVLLRALCRTEEQNKQRTNQTHT